MMDIELKKLQVEFKRVNSAREEMEYKVMEFQEQIKRLEDNIEISKAKENDLLAKIEEKKNSKKV